MREGWRGGIRGMAFRWGVLGALDFCMGEMIWLYRMVGLGAEGIMVVI